MPTTGRIFNIQHFSVHDGPGIRTTVFMKGCNLRCKWCHNPESRDRNDTMQFFPRKCIGCGECGRVCPEAIDGKCALFTDRCRSCGLCAESCYAEAIIRTGKTVSSDEVIAEVLRDRGAYERSGGGVTFSGGEPLLQPDFLTEMLTALRSEGIHTAIETALLCSPEVLMRVLPLVDLVMCDIKHVDRQKHIEGTGVPNERILANIRLMCESGVRPLLRTPVIPGWNDSDADISAIAQFVAALPGKPEHELLPFHGICVGKYESMSMVYPCRDLQTPSEERMAQLRQLTGNK